MKEVNKKKYKQIFNHSQNVVSDWIMINTLRALWTEGQSERILDASWDTKDVGKTESESILQLRKKMSIDKHFMLQLWLFL